MKHEGSSMKHNHDKMAWPPMKNKKTLTTILITKNQNFVQYVETEFTNTSYYGQ